MVTWVALEYWSREFTILCEGDPWPALYACLKVWTNCSACLLLYFCNDRGNGSFGMILGLLYMLA